MFQSEPKRQAKCPEIDQRVDLNQSKLQCRNQHGCEQKYCPLEAEFSPIPVDFALETWNFKKRYLA